MERIQIMQIISLTRLATFLLFLVPSFGCIASDNQQKDLEAILQQSFDRIHLAINGLEYPGSVRILNNCVKYHDKECLKAYKLVLEGKKMIKSVSSTKALETTLDIIERICLSKDENLAAFTCVGAVLSLYFYTSHEDDAKILNRIKIYPKQIRNIIFNNDFYWFYNRPNKDVWINAIPAMDIDWRNDAHKQRTLSLFSKTLAEMKDETWILK